MRAATGFARSTSSISASATRSTTPDHEGVAHHECAPTVRHPNRPVAWEAVESLELARRQASVAAVLGLDEVLEPRRRRAAFAGQDGPRRAVGRVREGDRPFVVRVLEAGRVADPGQALRALQELPLREVSSPTKNCSGTSCGRSRTSREGLVLADERGSHIRRPDRGAARTREIRMTPAFPKAVVFGPMPNVSLTTFTSRSSVDRRPVEGPDRARREGSGQDARLEHLVAGLALRPAVADRRCTPVDASAGTRSRRH